MKDNGQRATRGQNLMRGPKSHATTSETPKLADLGISRDQISKWQQLAEIPQKQFKALLVRPGRKPSTEGMLAEAGLKRRTESIDPFLARLDDFRYRHGFERGPRLWLIQAAFDKKLAPKAAGKKKGSGGGALVSFALGNAVASFCHRLESAYNEDSFVALLCHYGCNYFLAKPREAMARGAPFTTTFQAFARTPSQGFAPRFGC